MVQPYVKIRTTNPDGTTADITELCRAITWSGDSNSVSRTLTFSPIVSEVDTMLPAAPTELGGSAQFWQGNTLLMDAFSLQRTRDSLSSAIDVIAYDRGIYLTRNKKTMRVAAQTAETVTEALCREFGIQIGALAVTGVPLTRNFLGVNLYKIIMTMYTLAADQTRKKYRIRFRGALLEVVEMVQTAESILLRPGCNLLSFTAKEDASNVINSVALYDDEYNQLSVHQDDDAVSLYGLMREVVKASSYDDPVAHAKKLLAENGMKTSISLNALGNPKLITGNTVVVQEPVTNTYGLFWITGDTHTWKRNIYQTKLSRSLEAIMDSQTAGSLPTE